MTDNNIHPGYAWNDHKSYSLYSNSTNTIKYFAPLRGDDSKKEKEKTLKLGEPSEQFEVEPYQSLHICLILNREVYMARLYCWDPRDQLVAIIKIPSETLIEKIKIASRNNEMNKSVIWEDLNISYTPTRIIDEGEYSQIKAEDWEKFLRVYD